MTHLRADSIAVRMGFEYRLVSPTNGYQGPHGRVKPPANARQLEEVFDEFGRDGFEFAGVVADPGRDGDVLLVFKRPQDG